MIGDNFVEMSSKQRKWFYVDIDLKTDFHDDQIST